MQGYQTSLGQGLRQEGYRKSTSFQNAQVPTALDQVGTGASPSGFARMPSAALDQAGAVADRPPEPDQDADRIAAVRPSGYEEDVQNTAGTEAAVAAPAVARRQGSLLQKGKLRTRKGSVADRLKNVRGLLDTADATGADDIQEELPVAVVQEISGIDEPIAEEPQLAVN